MRIVAVAITPVLAVPLLLYAGSSRAAAASSDRMDNQAQAVSLDGRWQLNTDLSDQPPEPGEGRELGQGAEGRGRGGGGRHPGGGGFPGGVGGMGGGGMRGGGPGAREGHRPNPEEMARMRDAMRAALDAPAEIIVTRKDDEVVFTAAGSGDVNRILVTGKKMKTTAGGAEHEVKAEYKDDALVVESNFGPMKVVDTWRVSPDHNQLERVTKVEGGRAQAGDKARQIRRVYDRAP